MAQTDDPLRELPAERCHRLLPFRHEGHLSGRRGVVAADRPGGAAGSQARPARARSTVEDYRRGEKDAGISSLFSCRIGRTPDCGGHWPPLRDSSRIRVRTLESFETQTGTEL